MSDKHDFRQIADAYVAAFNARDIDRLAALFADTVTLRDWSLDERGREAVLQANRDMFAATTSIEATVLKSVVQDRTVVLELVIEVNRSDRLTVVDILEFDDSGRLLAIRAYKG